MPASTHIILYHARIATMNKTREEAGFGFGLIEADTILIENGRVGFVGYETDLPSDRVKDARIMDLDWRLVTPALIDCHTHLVHGGNRAHEFKMRLQGASYEDISRAGGGILSTVAATNALSVDALVETALPRLDALLCEGISTVEVKSGYGLTIKAELDMLRAARLLEKHRPVRIVTSYLAAHAIPPSYKGRGTDYMRDIALPGLEQAVSEGLVDAVDGFCDKIAFSTDEIALLFDKAQSLEMPIKLHAEQLSPSSAAQLAASYGALSADHLEYLDEEGVQALARAQTVAVLLPGAFYNLQEKKKPPVAALRQAGVKMAIATDCNPGSSPLTSLLLAMNMAATLFGLTVEECLAAVTCHAAQALGLSHETGSIEVGKAADLAIWNIEAPEELVYRLGFNPLDSRFFKGRFIS